MGIFKPREAFRPFEYPEFENYIDFALSNPWSPYSVSMIQDKIDWYNSDQKTKNVIGGILRGFTLAENVIGDQWVNAGKLTRKPEIVCLCKQFSSQEVTHAIAYNHLDASLGLDSYQAFIEEETAVTKVRSAEERLSIVEDDFSDIGDEVLNLAIFAGGYEGVSLFSAFAILLSFSRSTETQACRFPGMAEILSWSVIDEDNHSEAGILLFNIICKEHPYLRPIQDRVFDEFRLIVNNEKNFVNKVFSGGDLPQITLFQVISFIEHRANKKLKALGYDPMFNQNMEAKEAVKQIASWFYPLTQSIVNSDFFANKNNGSGYTSLAKPMGSVDMNKLNERLKNV